ncbi:MAG: hypothetical protein GXO82_10530 [Chlorobi bacterium]|nr:hypothetical protein [Chlorobiota bacterium]
MTPIPSEDSRNCEVAVIGEVFVELQSTGASLTNADSFTKQLGGSAALVASAVSALGSNVCMTAAVGADALGTFIQNALQQHEVDVSCLQYSRDHPTSVVFKARSGKLTQALPYRYADWHLHSTRENINRIQNCAIIYGSGYILWKNPARHSLLELLRVASKAEITTIFYPYFESTLWRSRSDAYAVLKKTLKFVDIVTPTVEVAEHFFGKQSHEETVKRYHDMLAKNVVLNLGNDGCLVSKGNSRINHLSPPGPVNIDSPGINEAFQAALLVATQHGKELETATRFALAAATYASQKNGPELDLPSAETICQEILQTSFEAL